MTAQSQAASSPASQPADVQPALAPAPAAAPTPVPTVVVPGAATQISLLPGVPQTAQELAALRARREEMSTQLNSATSRRNSLSQRIRRADGADRAGLEQRLQLLDRRILQLENDIAVTGQQLTAAPAGLLASSTSIPIGAGGRRIDFGGRGPGFGPLLLLVVFAPLALAWARLLWRRGSHAPVAARDAETAQRLAQLENAVDTIAIEVERVAEGQRFVTKLLAEASGVPASSYQASDRDTLPVRGVGSGDRGY